MGVEPSKRIGICPRGQEGRGADRASAEVNDKTFIFYTCLPDTVDPRGPKGKLRQRLVPDGRVRVLRDRR